eukprot:TRINITY_DN5407_c0_g1_i1.p1 TRINITY_DN5407_c0_g1~~TRINITY_DN5407_c0_g1_i1.p1  ORF type:complete len:801 (-),score=286.01 TRINITY_DN5407_c0_g1_i1:107-2509(-)
MRSLLLCALVGILASVASAGLQEVYLVPHSHCDAGWLITADAYFWTEVQYILNSVVESLTADTTLRFVWAETIWLDMWWNQVASPTQKLQFQKLVANKQLEFVGGGWVMNDEPIAIYNDVIDQVTTGHEWLRNNIGPEARVRHGWQIDMFSGFSSVTPSLWALMGYDATVIRFEGSGPVQANWTDDRGYEFIWQGSKNLKKEESEIFTHTLQHNYGDLLGIGFDFDSTANPANNPPITNTNIGNRSQLLASTLTNMSSYYRGPLMAVWGSDFRFKNASYNFGNMTLLINYINANPSLFGLHIQYATLADYFDTLHAMDLKWPFYDQTVDFEIGWPHAIRAYNLTTQYQTGALTSRPYFKGLIRHSNAHLRPAEILYSLAQASVNASVWQAANGPQLYGNLVLARQARGLVQHHDSLAGTMASEQNNPNNTAAWCLEDYINHLNAAIVASDSVVTATLGMLAADAAVPTLSADPATVQQLSPQQDIAVLVHNPLGWNRHEVVNVQLPTGVVNVRVVDADGAAVPAELHPFVDGSMHLWFEVDVVPLGFATYFVEQTASTAADRAPLIALKPVALSPAAANFTLENAQLEVTFDGATGRMASVASRDGTTTMRTAQQFGMYQNGTGGAYILYEPTPATPIDTLPQVSVSKGQLVQQAFNFYADNLWQVVRLFNISQQQGHIQYSVQVLHHAQMLQDPNELVTVYSTDLDTQGSWFIDESGLEMNKRVFDPTLPGNVIGANYHAMVSSCYLRSADSADSRQFTVLSSQSLGVISQQDGQIELMLHRRTNSSDSQGPYPLNDTR